MPFRSAKQRRFLYAKKPAIAKKFAAHSGAAIVPKRKRRSKK